MPLAHTDDQWSTEIIATKASREKTVVPVSAAPVVRVYPRLQPPNPLHPLQGQRAAVGASGSSPTKPAPAQELPTIHFIIALCEVFHLNFLLSLVSALGSLPTQKIAPPRISKNAFPINSLVLSSLFCLSRSECLEASQSVFFSSLFCLSR